MEYQTLNKNEWSAYFDLLSKTGKGKWMQLELVGADVGDQIEEDWFLFDGVSYDQPEDILYVHADRLEHAVVHPENVIIQDNGALNSISIKDAEGHIQIIHFRDPLLLDSVSDSK